jgi:uncharacterized protein
MAQHYTEDRQALDKSSLLPYGAWDEQFLYRRCTNMRKLDVLAGVLLVVGGLNWGLVAAAEFDLVAWVFGEDFGGTTVASRVVYGLVGVAAIYAIAAAMARRSAGAHQAAAASQ